MSYLNATFKALLNEATFTKEMFGSGVTQIRAANYSSKGRYFQAFTSLSTGLERIGKLVLMLDHYIDHGGAFPESKYLKEKIRHDLIFLYRESQSVVQKREVTFRFDSDLSGQIHQAIIKVLSDFAKGDRYANINLILGQADGRDPIREWFLTVDQPIYHSMVSARKKAIIGQNAEVMKALIGAHSFILHVLEGGDETTDIEETSMRSGIQAVVGPYRQFHVLQIIRYWVELLAALEAPSSALGKSEIPHFLELFAAFYNDDQLLKRRKKWEE